MARSVFHAVNLRYEGQPTISITIDGTAVMTNQQLPNHTVLKQRRISLPQGVVGYTPQLQTSFTDSLVFEFEGVPEQTYANQQLFHFFEVQFSGTVQLEIYADETRKNVNNSDDTSITLTARNSRRQDIRRVYFPPLTYGWVPQLKTIVDSSEDGQVLSSQLRSLPARFSRGEKEHSQIQVTHQGDVTLEVILDGDVIDTYQFEADPYNEDAFVTQKEYIQSGARGHVLQWIQTEGTGEVALFETDTTLTDRDQPQQEV